MNSRLILLLQIALAVLAISSQLDAKNASSLPLVVASVEEVDDLRSTLALALPPVGTAVNESTFAQVCKPVGARIQALAKEHQWQFIQMSEKFRNPKHKPDDEAQAALKKFSDDSKLDGFWTKKTSGGIASYRYFRRITIEPSCTVCHGDESSRPGFIKSQYPADRAFGFKVGDLRGVYSVSWSESNR